MENTKHSETPWGLMRLRKFRVLALTLAFVGFLGMSSVACEDDGPLEEAGEEIDDALDG